MLTRQTDPKLNALTAAWQAAKLAEHNAKEQRLAIERDIIAITGKRDAGQMTVDTDIAKITIKTNVALSFDWSKWDSEIAGQIPEHLHPVKTKRELDDAGIKYLRESRPELYAIVAQALTRKENKPSLDIKLL